MTKDHIVHSIVGTKLVRKLAEEGRLIFTTGQAKDLASSIGLNPMYLNSAMHYLAKEGWVINLKRGLYALSTSVPGVSPLHEFAIAMALANPVAISHWSALNYHGLTEQIPRYVFVLTYTGLAPRDRKMNKKEDKLYVVNGLNYKFVQVNPSRFFGTEDIWINGDTRIAITDIERTLLDCLISPQYCGGFAEVLGVFENHIDKIDIDKIIGYALRLDSATTKRLGWILEAEGIEAKRLKPLLEAPIKGYRLLDPTGKHFGKCNKKWMIQVNQYRTK